MGQRNKLEIINIFTESGKINNNAPKEYIGSWIDLKHRKKILEELKDQKIFC